MAASISTSITATPVGSTHLLKDATTPSSLFFDDDEQLAKISASCLTRRENELLAGGILRNHLAHMFDTKLITEAAEAIGLAELRAVAGFAPPGPWTAYREPTKSEIAAAPTIEEYYELREPRTEAQSLDSPDFFEKNFPPAIEFLDARFPAIRAIYRRKFGAIRRLRADANMRIDRNEVDEMINEYIRIAPRISAAIDHMHTLRANLPGKSLPRYTFLANDYPKW